MLRCPSPDCSSVKPISGQPLFHQVDDIGDRVGHRDVRRCQRLNLALGGAGVPGDDGAGVAHALARRGRAPGDKPDDRVLHIVLMYSAASSSSEPPISPIITTTSV